MHFFERFTVVYCCNSQSQPLPPPLSPIETRIRKMNPECFVNHVSFIDSEVIYLHSSVNKIQWFSATKFEKSTFYFYRLVFLINNSLSPSLITAKPT